MVEWSISGHTMKAGGESLSKKEVLELSQYTCTLTSSYQSSHGSFWGRAACTRALCSRSSARLSLSSASALHWVAGKELKLGYHSSKTVLLDIHICSNLH